MGCFAFLREIEDIPKECSDVGVARLKLDWWRQEVGRWERRSGNHPISKTLIGNDVDHSPFTAVVDVADRLLEPRPIDTMEQLITLFRQGDGKVFQMLAARLGGSQPQADLMDLAAGIALVRRFRDLRPLLHRNLPTIPSELLAHYGLDASHPATAGPQLNEALQAFLTEIRLTLSKALNKHTPLPFRALGTIHLALCRELERTPWAVLDQRTELTPLRKFWLSWRA